MRITFYLKKLAISQLILHTEAKKFDINAQNNIAVYWGQNSVEIAHKSWRNYASGVKHVYEPTLLDVCKDPNVDIVLISFMNNFPGNRPPLTSKIFQNTTTSTISTTTTMGKRHKSYTAKMDKISNVPTISLVNGEYSTRHTSMLRQQELHINLCQQKYHKKILLSLGGESGNYGFQNSKEAVCFADWLWYMFGNGTHTGNECPNNKYVKGHTLGKNGKPHRSHKPFGDVILDGFDLDIENHEYPSTYYIDFAKKLRKNFKDSPKEFFLSAAPQCLYPEENMQEILDSDEVFFDFLFIQFYNNGKECNANTNNFNYEIWIKQYAMKHGKNGEGGEEKFPKLFMGLPADSSKAGAVNGYIQSRQQLVNKIGTVLSLESKLGNKHYFGGISLWEASLGYNNYDLSDKDGDINYIQAVKNALNRAENYSYSGDSNDGEDNDGNNSESTGSKVESTTLWKWFAIAVIVAIL